MNDSRRQFLKSGAVLGLGLIASPALVTSARIFTGATPFTLAPLPYANNALEPYIDALTMDIHHDKHHKAYVDNLNKALGEYHMNEISIEKLLSQVSSMYPGVRNNAGGHWNHTFFWKSMKPGGGGSPKGELADAINSTYGSFESFKGKFTDAAKSRFGSGWAWLLMDKGKLVISTSPNQDNPLMDIAEQKGSPLLALDVWEHAYYLKYQNRRAEYIDAWWNTVDWDEILKRYKTIK